MIYKPVKSRDYPGWYEIPGYSRYAANEDGEILTKKTRNFTRGGISDRYLRVSVYRDGDNKPTLQYVHDLVCRAFNGPPPPNMVVLHADDDRFNNRKSNLSWGTQSQNILDVYKRGLRRPNRMGNESFFYW